MVLGYILVVHAWNHVEERGCGDRNPEGLSAAVVLSMIVKYFPFSYLQVGLPDLKHKNIGCTVKFEFWINDK